MFIITEDPVQKNGAKFTEELWIVVWRPIYFNYGAAKSPGLGLLPSSAKPAEAAEILIAQLHSQGT
jgi:hypothetical protein